MKKGKKKHKCFGMLMIFFATHFLFSLILWTYSSILFNVFIGPVSHFEQLVVSQKK